MAQLVTQSIPEILVPKACTNFLKDSVMPNKFWPDLHVNRATMPVIPVIAHETHKRGLTLQSRRNLGARLLSILLAQMAVIFDFTGSGRLGRERNLY